MAAAGLAGCGSSAPQPGDIAENYMSAVAVGNYSGACSMLTPRARAALVSAKARRHSCEFVFRHCIHIDTLALKRDQTQLLFADIEPVIHGAHSSVAVSGTAVAHELRRLTMVRVRGSWRIVGAGRALSRCRVGRGRRTRKSAAPGIP